MKDFNEFANSMRDAISDFYGDDYNIELLQIPKNNNVILTGLNIRKKTSNISPTIYLEDAYKEYTEGVSFVDMVKRIIEVYDEHKIEDVMFTEDLIDFEKVRSRIVYKLISADNNPDMLKDIPHKMYLDMAVVFYYNVLNDDYGHATIMIKNDLAQKWGVNENDLMKIARDNTPRLMLPDISGILDLIFEGKIVEDKWKDQEDLMGRSMYVMTNKNKIFGAATIMYPGVLGDFSETVNSNIYVLPSSVHEVILIPEKPGITPGALKDIVMSVNRTQLDPVEFLSDSVYYYDRNKQELEMAM